MLPSIRPLDWKYLREEVCLLGPLLHALPQVPRHLEEREDQVPNSQVLVPHFRLPCPIETCVGAYLL